MSRYIRFAVLLSLLLPASLCSIAWGQSREDNTVRNATAVINQIMTVPAQRIPASMLSNAHGVAIIPNVVKVGFIGGVRHGRGLLLVRDDNGGWIAPQFITMTGGSVGWQIGVQSTDVILVFRTRKSVDSIGNGKFTIGVDAAAAAGPVGRQAAAATDAQLRAEILSYSRSRGLFAGVSLDGSAIQMDQASNAAFYYPAGFSPQAAATGQGAVVPQSAIQLVATVSRYATPPPGTAALVEAPTPTINPVAPTYAPPSTFTTPLTPANGQLQQQLADSAIRLNALLDDNWRQFLALPGEIFHGTQAPNAPALEASLTKYDQVARDPQFRTLAMRPEFKATHDLLQRYAASQAQNPPGALTLPPPPTATSQLPGQQR